MDPRLGSTAALAEIQRAARVLWVRSRREATSWLVGGQASAFRGGGIEFEDLRPYAPGDDPRWIDWNATARSGVPWVKRFREERAHTLLLAIDASASMGFGTTGRTKLGTAAHAAALLAASAGRAGDRVGLLVFGDGVRAALAPARGDAHVWRVVKAAATASAQARGATDLGSAARWILAHARRRAIVVLLSDFRDAALAPGAPPPAKGASLAALAHRHDLVAAVVEDPREHALVAAGGLRLRDPERAGETFGLGTRRRRRARFAAAAAARHLDLAHRLRADGAEPLWLSTAEDPVRTLGRFFRARAPRGRGLRR